MPAIPFRVIAQYRDRPREFAEDLIFRYVPSMVPIKWNRHQLQALEAIANNEFVSIRSGRGKGKSMFAAICIVWYLITRPHSRVICTAPKADLLNDVLWAEVNKWLQYSPLKEIIEWGKEKIFIKQDGVCDPGWYAVARTAKSKENISGYHENYQMIITDEASGVIDEILETAEMTQINNLQKIEIKTLLISNPTRVTGYFHSTQTKWAHKWNAIHFKPTQEEVDTDPGALRVKELYGEDHDLYRVSVLGEFPSGNPMAVISYTDAWAARQREVTPTGSIEIGVDVARSGEDATVLSYRYGLKLYPVRRYKKEDAFVTLQRVKDLVKELRTTFSYESVIKIKIDDSNMGSGGIVDHLLRDTENNIEVIKCLFGGKGNDRFSNEASAMWGNFENLIKVISIPDDEDLFEEICGRNWETSLDIKGRRRVESKDSFKKRAKRSPDRADSVIMCFWGGDTEAKILPRLVTLRSDIFRDEPPRLDRFVDGKKVELFGSVWHEKSMRDSVVCGAWDRELGVFNLFWEGQSRLGGPSELLDGLTNVTSMYARRFDCTVRPRQFIWYGSRSLFGLADGAASFENIKHGPFIAWRNQNIYMNVNFRFDLGGAISDLNKMIEEGRIIIAPDLLQLKVQLETWVIDNERPDNEGHALCLALANLVSMLVQTKRTRVEPRKLVPYSSQKEAFMKKITESFNTTKRLVAPSR